jgi:hypothetical protein
MTSTPRSTWRRRSIAATHWLDARWGIHAALGIEHRFTISTRASVLPDGSVQRDTAKVWLSQPLLQAGASLRF